jgi:hypothetical protein
MAVESSDGVRVRVRVGAVRGSLPTPGNASMKYCGWYKATSQFLVDHLSTVTTSSGSAVPMPHSHYGMTNKTI